MAQSAISGYPVFSFFHAGQSLNLPVLTLKLIRKSFLRTSELRADSQMFIQPFSPLPGRSISTH